MANDARWNKIPAVTLAFRITKIAATTFGETGGDAVSMSMNLGYPGAARNKLTANISTLSL